MFTLTIGASSYAELKQKVAELHSDVNGVELIDRQLNLGEAPIQRFAKAMQKVSETVSTEEILNSVGGTKPADTTTKLESSIDDTPVSHLDKDGRVWDVRIDSPLKTKDRFGRWKPKIGVDKTTRIRIIEELKSGTGSQPEPVKEPEPTSHPAEPLQSSEVDTSTSEQVQQIETEAPVTATQEQPTPVPTPEAEPVQDDVVHMSLEHFQSNFATVMSELFNAGKISGPKVQQLCEIARVQQAYQIPLDDTSCKAVYNTLVKENLI